MLTGSGAPAKIYNVGNHHPEELTQVVSLLEKELGRAAVRDMLPMQPGDVTETFADVADLMRDAGFRPQTPIEDGICATSSRGTAATTRFETTDEPTNYSTDHVRRRRNAAVAGLARGASEAVPAAVRAALDLSGHAAAGVGCGAVRAADRHHQ